MQYLLFAEDPFNAGEHNYFVPSGFSGGSDYSPPVAKHNPPSARSQNNHPVPAPPQYNPAPHTLPSYGSDRHPAPAPPTYNNPSQNPPSYESIVHHAPAPPAYNPRPQTLRSNHLSNLGKNDVPQSYHSPSGSNLPRGSPPSIYPATESYNPPSGRSYVNAPSPPSYDQVAPSYNPPAQPSYESPSSNPPGRGYGGEPSPPSRSYEKGTSSSQTGFIHESSESFLIHSGLHDLPYKDTQPPQYEIPVFHHRTSGGTKRKGENNIIYLTLIMYSEEKQDL